MFIQPKYVLSSLSGTSHHIIKQPRNHSIKAQNVDKMVLVKRWCQLKADSGPGAQVYFLVLLDFLKYVFVNLLLSAATTTTTTPTTVITIASASDTASSPAPITVYASATTTATVINQSSVIQKNIYLGTGSDSAFYRNP